MSGFVMLLLIIGVLYIALTYFKGPRNTDTNKDGITTRPFGGGFSGNDNLPQDLDDAADDEYAEEGTDEDEDVDEDDETAEAEEGFEADEQEGNPEVEPEEELIEKPEEEQTEKPEEWRIEETEAGPEADEPENDPTVSGVQIDSEVRIDAQIPDNTGTTGFSGDSGK